MSSRRSRIRWCLAAVAVTALGASISSCGGGEEAAPRPTDPIELGRVVYGERCQTCHGEAGGGWVGPAVDDVTDRLGTDEIAAVVIGGRNGMPAWGDTLAPAEIDAVVEYLVAGMPAATG